MGLAEILTIVFVVLKLTGVIDWSWWLVLLPEIIVLVLLALWFLGFGLLLRSRPYTFK